jgi:hypothetical protein
MIPAMCGESAIAENHGEIPACAGMTRLGNNEFLKGGLNVLLQSGF